MEAINFKIFKDALLSQNIICTNILQINVTYAWNGNEEKNISFNKIGLQTAEVSMLKMSKHSLFAILAMFDSFQHRNTIRFKLNFKHKV